MLRWFERRIEAFPVEAPVQPPTGLVRFCLHYTRPMLPILLVLALTSASVALIEVALMGFLGDFVNLLAASDRSTFMERHGGRMAAWGALMLLGLPLFGLVYSLVHYQGIVPSFPMRIRWLAHRWLLGQSTSFFADELAGRVSTKVMQTALAVRETVVKLLDVFLYVSIYFFGGMVLLATTADVRLVLPMAGWLLLYVVVIWYFVPKLGRAAERQADARSVMTGRIVDSYTNIQTVKLFAHSEREERHARAGMSEFLDTVFAQFRLVTGVQVTINVLNGLLLFSVSGLALWMWLEASISLGAITIGIGLALRMHGMAQWILWEVSALFENIGTVMDGMATLTKPRAVVDRPDATELRVERGEVRYEHVTFHYGKGKGVIEDLSLSIHAGEKVGLVGRSGAGKSTLVNLLLRFHDLEGGRITVDGQDISRVRQDSLRQHIGMVTQDTALLHRSVRDNILYGRPDATEAELWAAIRSAHAEEFIAELIDADRRRGLDAFVGERGVRLSGGQRQRIALARVFLKNAPILLLDEATSALDSEVEAAIQESLYTLMEGKTVIAIAHRLSTIAHMDRLVIVDRGAIIEEGTHAELLERDGLYASLWRRQSGGFLAADAMPAAV